MMQKYLSLIAVLISLSVSITASAQNPDAYVDKPESPELYQKIVQMDSIYFTAYNGCDMDKQAAIYADSIEFYHDGSGLQTSKSKLLAAIKENICGKVIRVLVPGNTSFSADASITHSNSVFIRCRSRLLKTAFRYRLPDPKRRLQLYL